MSWLQCLLGNRYNLLQLWKKYEIFAESNRVRSEQPWRHFSPWTCDLEEQQSWSHARTFWTIKNVLPGETDAEKGTSANARKPPNDTFTMVRKWYVQKFVVCHRVERKHIVLYDRIALEKHIYVATKAEIIQNSKHWILTLNTEGPQPPLNQRPDFAKAKRECKRLHDEHLARTQEECRTILRSQ